MITPDNKHKTILETYKFSYWNRGHNVYRNPSGRRIFVKCISKNPILITEDYHITNYGIEGEFIYYGKDTGKFNMARIDIFNP